MQRIVSERVDKEIESVTRKGDTLVYARVSTADQDAAGQQDRLIEAGAVRVSTDVISERRFERPGLAKLVDHARPVDRLCVTRLDRLGRSLKELLETVEDLKRSGIHLVSLEERLDTSSAAGELVFHVFGAIAHFERRWTGANFRSRDRQARVLPFSADLQRWPPAPWVTPVSSSARKAHRSEPLMQNKRTYISND